MSIICKDLINKLQNFFPDNTAEDWDNVGLLIGENNKVIEKILICLDVTNKVIEEAINNNIDLIISHHPIIFSKINKINDDTILGEKIIKLIKNNINVYSAHTNLDSQLDGLNKLILDNFNVSEYEFLYDTSNDTYKKGLGLIAETNITYEFYEFIDILKNSLQLKNLRYIGQPKDIKKIAICTGSGSEFWTIAQSKKADVYITGDLKYHTAVDVMEKNFLIIDAGHYNTEIIVINYIYDILNSFNLDIDIIKTNKSEDPFKVI